MKIQFVILLALVCHVSSPLKSEEIEVTSTQQHLAFLYTSSMRDEIVSRLAVSGLAQAEIETIATAAIDRYAKCGVDALGEIDNPAAAAFLSALKEGLSAEELDTRLRAVGDAVFGEFIVEFSERTGPCRVAVDLEFGIPQKH